MPATLGADLDHNTDERKSLFVDILFIQLQIPFSFVGESRVYRQGCLPRHEGGSGGGTGRRGATQNINYRRLNN